MAQPSWRLLEAFVHIARSGSISAGARALGVSQPTATRYLQELESALSTGLFVRHSRGLTLTERGEELYSIAREVNDRVDEVFRRAAGLGRQIRGSVRISVNEPIGVLVLSPCLAELRSAHPDLSIELVIDNSTANLSRREADVAVRMFRPKQLDLVARRVGSLEVGLFATVGYLERHGMPRALADVKGHTLIGFDRDTSWLSTLEAIGMTPDAFAFRTDSVLAQMEAVVAGVGIGGMQLLLAQRHPELRRVLSDLPLPPLELWVVMHRDLGRSAATRVVFDALVRALSDYSRRPAHILSEKSRFEIIS